MTDGTGLQYLRARYYSPGQGRFITQDPFPGYLSQPATLNAYAYALNNPATLTDPSGEFVSPIAIIAIAGFAAGAVYDAYQQTDGFTTFCQYDILQTLSTGVGGAAAASMTAIMLVGGVGLVGLGLHGVALGLSSIGISAGVSTSLFIAGTASAGWSSTAMVWLFTSQSLTNNVASHTTVSDPLTRLPDRTNASGKTSGILVAGHNEMQLDSGWSGPALQMPQKSPGFNIVTRTHVEGHASALMHQNEWNSATLFINNPPCSSCEKLLPRMLPENSSLRILGPNGYDELFFGLRR